MPSLLELVTSLLGDGDTFEKLGELIGGDPDQAKSASELATPAILGGLAASADSDSGLDTVMGILDDSRPVLDDLGGFLERGEAEAGNSIVDGLFGGGRADLVSGLAAEADIGGPIVGKLLPLLAPIVAAVIGNERSVQELDAAGVGTMLAEEQASLERAGIPHMLADFPTGGGDAKIAAVAAAGVAGAAAAGSKAKDAAGDAAEAVVDKVGDAKAAVTPGVKGIVGGDDDDNGRSGLGWLWWALGAVALVLLMAWLLSQCNDDSEDIDAGSTAEVAVDGDDDSDGDSDDSDGDDSDGDSDSDAMADDDSDGDSDTDSNTDSDGDSHSDSDGDSDGDSGSDSDDADLQDAVDAALSGTGVTGAVSNGVVTLTGTVDSDDEVVDAVSALAGVDSVDNKLKVDAGGSTDDSDPDDDQQADSGDTINELLDLDPVTFRVGSANITDAGQAVLDDASDFMLANPAIEVEIGGHTDNDGKESENLDLSQRRADSVEQYLIGKGIDGDRMETKGYGESQPKVDNNSSASKAENRRIEFIIL